MRFLIVPALALLFCCSCSTQAPVSAAPSAPPAPEYGWQTVDTQVLGVGPIMDILAPANFSGRVRVTIKAEGPVTFAIGPHSALGSPVLAVQSLPNLPCSGTSVLEKSLECKVPRNAWLFMLDNRSTTAELVGAYATKSAEVASKATGPNRVTLEIARWQCIANCPSPRQP